MPTYLSSALSMQIVGVGCRVYFFQAGTTLPQAVYADKARTIARTNPVLTDIAGRMPVCWYGSELYRIRIVDAYGGLVGEFEDVPGWVDDPVIPDPTESTIIIPTGLYSPFHGTQRPDGWVRLNGLTMGRVSGTEHRGEECKALFEHLWNEQSSLVVVEGRGANSLADWDAGKRITLPDMRGRVPAGRDGMGNAQVGRLTTFHFDNPDAIGGNGGVEKIVLTWQQLAPHVHTGTTDPDGGHTPTGSTSEDGNHQHVSTDSTYQLDALAAAGTGGAARNTLVAESRDTQFAGPHTHTLDIDAVPDHTHSYTSDATGLGEAHSSLQPTKLTTYIMKL